MMPSSEGCPTPLRLAAAPCYSPKPPLMTRWAGKGARKGLKGGGDMLSEMTQASVALYTPLNVGVHSIRSQMVMEIITVKTIVYCSNGENFSFNGDSRYSGANGNTAPNMLQVLF